MNSLFTIPYCSLVLLWVFCCFFFFFYLGQWQRLTLLWLWSVYSNFCLHLQKLNAVVLGSIALEFLSYCFVLTLALVIQEAFYSEINLIWFSDNTTQCWAQNWSSWLAHIFFSTPFSFHIPPSPIPLTLSPVAYLVIFIHWQEQQLSLSSAQGLKDENTCGIHVVPEQVERSIWSPCI